MTDEIPLPPVRREFASPAGDFLFALSTGDRWKSRHATGELFETEGKARKSVWSRELPHDLGPRYALVGAGGRVLLLDEWINVKSRFAVMVLDRDNHVVAQHSFEEVWKALGVPGSEIGSRARHGTWISSPPILDPSGETAGVEAGGKELTIRLQDGRLSAGGERLAR